MTRLPIAIALLALPLAACDKGKDGTSISITSNDADGNVLAAMDGKTGEVKVDLPGFSGALKLPKININAEDFDLNGVHLYPGSTIKTMNILGHDDDGTVKVTFDSPASPAAVRDWFQQRLDKVGYKISTVGAGLAGKTDENKAFKLDLAPAADNHAAGTIVIG